VHAPKEHFYAELGRVLDLFPKYHVIILLGDLNAKAEREDILKRKIGKVNSYEISNDNGV
jgi:hypothetical protein